MRAFMQLRTFLARCKVLERGKTHRSRLAPTGSSTILSHNYTLSRLQLLLY